MRPASTDYAEYYSKYIELVKEDNVLNVLDDYTDIIQTLRKIPQTKENFSYASGKWSVKQVIGHMIDTERIMAYRALRISRNDTQPLPGFDQEEYIKNGSAHHRPLNDLISEFEAVRKSNLYMFHAFTDDELKRKGIASGYEVTVFAILFIIAGHGIHHMHILKEKYL